LDAQGHAWTCGRGFRQQDSECIALSVPKHAYIDYSGNDWTCEDGFRLQDGACRAEK
jgi:hypothetical protein